MAAAILPTPDYWTSSSYQEKRDGHAGLVYASGRNTGLVYAFGRNSYQSKRKVVGGSSDYGNPNMDPKLISLQSHHVEKEWSYSSPSSNFVNGGSLSAGKSSYSVMYSPTSEPSGWSDLRRPSSTPPVLDPQKLSFESISYGQRSVDRIQAKQRFPRNGQDGLMRRPKGFSFPVPDSTRNTKNKSFEEFQSDSGKGGSKNFRAVSLLDKTQIAFRKDSMHGGRTEKKLGKKLAMEQVTLLKRGETIQNAVETGGELGPLPIGKQERLLKDRVPVSNVGTAMQVVPQKSKGIGASKVVPKVANSDDANAKKMIKKNVGDAEKSQKLDDDLVITSTERLGPDPSVLPKERSGILRSFPSGISVPEAVEDNLSMLPLAFGSGGSSQCLDSVKIGTDHDLKMYPLLTFELRKWSVPAFCNSPPPSSLPLPKFSARQNGKSTTAQVRVDTSATKDLRRLLGLE